MIDVGLARLAKTIQDALAAAPSQDLEPARVAVADALRAHPRIVLGAWEALRARGAHPAPREHATIHWARAVIDAALAAVEISANENSRHLAARGLVDLFGTAFERESPGS